MSAESRPPSAILASEAAGERSEFSARRRLLAGEMCVALAGELDMATVPIADHELRQAGVEARHVLLDLRALTFIDACGLNMILVANAHARRQGGRLLVLCGPRCVRRLFELTGADEVLDVTTDPADHARVREMPAPFRCDVFDERDGVRVAPVGELDVNSAGSLERTVRELRSAGAAHLILDLRRLSFIDSTGLRLALDLHAEASRNGLRLELLPGPPDVQRLFELTGTLDQLPFVAAEPLGWPRGAAGRGSGTP